MTRLEAIAFFGSAANLSYALGISRSTVSRWNTVPEKWQWKLQTLTKGKLEVDTELMRPKANKKWNDAIQR